MNRWTIPAALTLGASIAVSCMVYGPDDLPATPSGGGSAGLAGMGRGGIGGGSGAPGGQGGQSPVGGAPPSGSGSGGALTGGSGNTSSGGRAGESFGGEGGEAGSPPLGGASGAGTGGTTGGGTGGGAVVDKTLLDDMEDGDHRLARVTDPPGPLRNGYWYTYATGTYTTLLPVPNDMFMMAEHPEGLPGPGDPPNLYAFRLYAKQVATGDPGNGAGAAFNLLNMKDVYDASRYVGVSFWVRASKSLKFRLKIATKSTDSAEVCDVCSDHHFVERDATTSWTKVQLVWDDPGLLQEGWGTPATFVPAELVGVQFFVPAMATSPEVELWLDDVAFIAPPVEAPNAAQ